MKDNQLDLSVKILTNKVNKLDELTTKLDCAIYTLGHIDFSKIRFYGKVVNFAQLGITEHPDTVPFVYKRKTAIIENGKPVVKEVGVKINSDYIEVFDTSAAHKRYILNLEELIRLAGERGLFE